MARAVSGQVVFLGARRKAKLEAIVRRPSSPQALVRRARIVLLARQRWANTRIAAELGCSVNTVRTWRHRFARGGNDSATFTGFLHRLDQCIDPQLTIHPIMDNGSSHTSKATGPGSPRTPGSPSLTPPSMRPGWTWLNYGSPP